MRSSSFDTSYPKPGPGTAGTDAQPTDHDLSMRSLTLPETISISTASSVCFLCFGWGGLVSGVCVEVIFCIQGWECVFVRVLVRGRCGVGMCGVVMVLALVGVVPMTAAVALGQSGMREARGGGLCPRLG